MTTATSGQSHKQCAYCNRVGLPILPLRYAIARADMGNAPDLAAPFGAGVKDIKLPESQAHYTLRLLRAGYLYVYDERYGKRGWTAYQVSEGGYLYQFDPNVEPPASGWAQEHFSCARNGNDANIARCITVQDAASAKRIWLGFSDVLWTPSVLEKHASETYRDAHMRKIDVATVRAGGNQPHGTKLANLMTRVAEYATTPTLLYGQTQPYVKKYLPTPLTDPRQLLETTDEAKFAYRISSTLVTGLLVSAVSAPLQKDGMYLSAPWAFSHAPLFADADRGPDMEQWATGAAKPYFAGMVALDDPVGVTMELNGLIKQLTAEFTEEPQRKWKHETALAIQMLQQSVENGGMKGVEVFAPTDAEADKMIQGVKNGAWAKYAKEMGLAGSAGELATETDTKLQAELEPYMPAWRAYKQAHVSPLVRPYLAWTQAESFTNYFTHNYDRSDLPSGHAFTEVLGAVFDGLGGIAKVVDHVAAELKKDPSAADALVPRALALNQDKLVAAWVKGAASAENHKLGGATVMGAAAAVYGPWEVLMTSDKTAGYKGIAKYVYRVSQSVLKVLAQEPLEAVMRAAYGARLYGVLGAVAKLEHPGLTLVMLDEAKTPQQAAKALNNALGKVLNRGGFETAVGHEVGGKARAMRAVALVDEAKLALLPRGPGGKVADADLRNVVNVTSIDDAIADTASLSHTGSATGGVVGFILTACTCALAVKDWGATAPGDIGLKQSMNLGSQAASLSGASFDATASVKEFFAARRAAAGFAARSQSLVDSAEWLSGAGRILGGAGGILAGVVGIWDGVDEFESGHKAIGRLDVTAGIVSIAAGIVMFTSWTGIGIVLGVIAAVLMLIVAYFTPNAVQDWINRSKLGAHTLTGAYTGVVPQQMALKALGG